jgi:hypothetical protein
VSFGNKKSSAELRARMDLKAVGEVVRGKQAVVVVTCSKERSG